MDYATKLRTLADYLEEHPSVHLKHSDTYDYPSIYIYTADWEDFQGIIRHMDGYEKKGSNGSLSARHQEKDDGETVFIVTVNVQGVCEQKPKLDEDGKPVTRKKQVWVETDEEEVIMEYVCPQVWTR